MESTNNFWELERHGESIALIDASGAPLSYSALAALADAAVAAIGPDRQLVLIECSNVVSVVAAYLGALRHGHPIILTGPGGSDPESELMQIFRPNFVFRPETGFQRASEAPVALHPDLAVLLSTSGSTGSPKLVRLSRENIASNAASIVDYLGMTARDRSPTCLPMQYSFGLSVINSALACGSSIFLTDASVVDSGFWLDFDRHRLTNFQGVPHSFELLARSGFLDRHHPSLSFFTQAGGKLARPRVETFDSYARKHGTRFYVMYGQTEASPRMAYVPPEDLHAHAGTIGRAVPGGELWVEEDGVRLADGQEGELVYAGPNVMMGYALAREDLAAPKQTHVLHTGDRARRTDAGYFEITGRASRFIKLFGLRFGLDDVENRLRHAGHVCGAAGTDDKLVIGLEKPAEGACEEVTRFVTEEFGLPGHAFKVLALDALPRAYNGKLDNRALLALADDATADSAGRSVIDEARILLARPNLDPAKSFVELGGDSLTYVQFSIVLEQRMGTLPDRWEEMPLADLDALAQTSTAAPATGIRRSLPTDVALRSVAIVVILMNHLELTRIFETSMLLMVLAGYNYARFQIGNILKGHGAEVLRNLFLWVVVPFYLMILPPTLASGPERLSGWPLPVNWFLMYNFVPDAVRDALPYGMRFFWFIEVYIWFILITTLVLMAFSPLRKLIAQKPAALPGVLLAAATAYLALGGQDYGTTFGVVAVSQRFFAGWLLLAMPGVKSRLAALAAIAAIFLLQRMDPADHPEWLILPGLLLLTLKPTLTFRGRVPVAFAALVGAIATSSLYIYMGQFYVDTALWKLFSDKLPLHGQLIGLVLCVAFGIAIQMALDLAKRIWARAFPGRSS